MDCTCLGSLGVTKINRNCDLFYAAQLTKPNIPVVNVIKLLKVKKSVTSGANVKKLFTVVTNEFS